MIIYMARNKINGKSYVGQTVGNLRDRRQGHIYNVLHKRDNSYFHNALRKYDIENFTWKIIHDNVVDIDELNRLEIYYIGYYDTYDNGYNLTLGGGGSIGFKFSEEAKLKMSEARAGENNSFYGKKHSKETKLRISKANEGKDHTEEARSKMSKNRKGKKLSEEHKRKISETSKGKNRPRPVIIGDKYFDTITETAKFIGITSTTIRYRISHKTRWLDYSYAEKRNK